MRYQIALYLLIRLVRPLQGDKQMARLLFFVHNLIVFNLKDLPDRRSLIKKGAYEVQSGLK